MITALRTGIVTAAAGATGFDSEHVFYGERPGKTGYPYLVLFGISQQGTDRDALTNKEQFRIQFSVRDTTLAGVETAGAALQAVFDYGESSITVTGWTVHESARNDIGLPARKFNNVWVWDFDYNFQIHKAR